MGRQGFKYAEQRRMQFRIPADVRRQGTRTRRGMDNQLSDPTVGHGLLACSTSTQAALRPWTQN